MKDTIIYFEGSIEKIDTIPSTIRKLYKIAWDMGQKNLIDQDKHYILESTHPSPLSANRGGWFGNGHFKKVNEILKNLNKNIIEW